MKAYQRIVETEDGWTKFDKYFEYIDSLEGQVPEEFLTFAGDRQRYLLHSKSSLHDAWLTRVVHDEIYLETEEATLVDSVRVSVQLKLAYGGGVVLKYSGVSAFEFMQSRERMPRMDSPIDLLTHEFSLLSPGRYSHTLYFHGGNHVHVEFERFDWLDQEA